MAVKKIKILGKSLFDFRVKEIEEPEKYTVVATASILARRYADGWKMNPCAAVWSCRKALLLRLRKLLGL